MAHQCELMKSNYRNWVKSALALKVIKEDITDKILHNNRNQGVSDLGNVSWLDINRFKFKKKLDLTFNFRQKHLTSHYARKNLDSKRSATGHDIVHTVRQLRNEIVHNSTLKVEKDDFKNFIGSVILMLEEIKLKEKDVFQQTVQKIVQIKEENRYISLSDEADALGIVEVFVDEMTNELQELIDDIIDKTGQQKQNFQEAFTCPLQKDSSRLQKMKHEVDILLTKAQALDVSDLSMGENTGEIRKLLSTIEIELNSLETVQRSRRRQLDIVERQQNDLNQEVCSSDISDQCTQVAKPDHKTKLKANELSVSPDNDRTICKLDLHQSSHISFETTPLILRWTQAPLRNLPNDIQCKLPCYHRNLKASYISQAEKGTKLHVHAVPELTKLDKYWTDFDHVDCNYQMLYKLTLLSLLSRTSKCTREKEKQTDDMLGGCANMLHLKFLYLESKCEESQADLSVSPLAAFWTQKPKTYKLQYQNTNPRLQNQNTDLEKSVMTVFYIADSKSFFYYFGTPLSKCLELEVDNIQSLFILSLNDGSIMPMRIFDAWLNRSIFRSLEEKKVDEGNKTVYLSFLLYLSLKLCAHKLVDYHPDCSKKTKDIKSYNGPDVCLHSPVRTNVSTVPQETTDTQQSRSSQVISENTNTPGLEENISLTLRPKKLMCNTLSGTVDLKVQRSSKVSENLDDSLKKDDEKAVILKQVISNGMRNANFRSDFVIAPGFKDLGENEDTGPNSEHSLQDHDNVSMLGGNSSGFEEQNEHKEDKNGASSAVSEVTMSKNQITKHSNEISVDGHKASGATGFTCTEKNSTQNQNNQIDSAIPPTRNKEIDSHVQTLEDNPSHTACGNPVVTNGTGTSDLPRPEVDHSEVQRFEPLMQIIDKIADGQRVPPQITMRYEMLRFCTLRSFPKENKPFITRLAQAGFYYANSGDEVVCYTCARRKSNWREDDIPMDIHQQLNPNCKYLLRNSEVNIPIKVSERLLENGINQTLHMLGQNGYHTNTTGTSNTSVQNTVQNSNQTSIYTSLTSFGSTGQNNTTALSSSNDTEHSHQTQERAHGNFVQTIATSSMPVERQLHQAAVSSGTFERLSSANSPRQSPQSTAEGTNMPTSPKYPKYASKTVRVTSFNDCGDIVVAPDSLAEAGFFYASFGDCVRCFQCGVGLRHWSEEDDPWIEHSRWSKDCSFVRAMKGQEFVNLVQMAVQYSQNNENEQASSGNVTGTTQGAHGGIDRENLMHTDAAQSVLEMGYHPDLIRKAIRSIKELNDREDLTATNLMEKIFLLEEGDDTANSEQHVEPRQQIQSSTAQSMSATSEVPGTDAENNSTQSQRHSDVNRSSQSNASLSLSVPRDDMKSLSIHSSGSDSSRAQKKSQLLEQKKLKQENEKMKQQSICTKCQKNDVCIVFLPCGHLVTCETCAPTVRYCTVEACGKYIKGTVRTYLA